MSLLVERIDALLPQTQCGECSYAGCKPYAHAIAEQGEKLNRCAPGGVTTLQALGNLLQQDVRVFIAEVEEKQKPPQLAKIREAECIGCTKCIQACPVDAIVGAAKQLHFIINAECTGCGLCVAPCPVDCIDMLNVESLAYQSDKARVRYNAKLDRKNNKLENIPILPPQAISQSNVADRKSYIQAAMQRAKVKKDQNTFS